MVALLPNWTGHDDRTRDRTARGCIWQDAYEWDHVIPNALTAAVMGSEKKTGSTLSTILPETSRKLRLFSNGTSKVDPKSRTVFSRV